MFRNISVTIGLILGLATFAASAQAASEAVRCVQNELNALGYDAGVADGLFGPKTFDAGEQYREYMHSRYGSNGWSQPALTSYNAGHICAQIADAHPSTAIFFTQFKNSQ